MATKKTWLVRSAVVIIALLSIGGVVAYQNGKPMLDIGTGYVAKQVCSCVFVAGRDHQSCLPDMLPEMASIDSEVILVDGKNAVRAWVPILAERVAVHNPGFGCAIQ